MKRFNFLTFTEKHKGIISAILVIILVIAISATIYKYDISDKYNMPYASYTIGDVTSFDEQITLLQGQTLQQRYTSKDFSYSECGFIVNTTDKNSVLTVEISNGSQTQSKTLTTKEINDTTYTYIQLNEEIKSEGETAISIVFTAVKGNFLFSANNSVEIDNSQCIVNENESHSNVVIDLRTMKSKVGVVVYITITIAIVILLAVLIFIIKTGHFKIENVTAFVIMFFCIICMIIFPPFTVPDEQTHYRAAYHVSNMFMLDFSDDANALRMRNCDNDFINNNSASLYKQSYISEKGFNVFFSDDTEVITTNYGYMTNKVIPYFAEAIGITLGRIIGLGPYWLFQLARLFNVIMLVVMIYFAIKIIPFGKGALATISLIPIMLHIIASCSYDNFTFGSITLLFAYIMKIMYAENKISWKQLLVLAIMIALSIPQKVVYIGVAAILLIIPKEKFAKPKLHLLFKFSMALIAVVAVLALQIGNTSKLTSDTVTYSETEGFSIFYILKNLGVIAEMLYRTVLNQSDFYLKSMISYFGWFELATPWFMAIPYFILLLLAFMRREDEPKALGFAQKTYSLILFIIVFLMIEIFLLIDHTTRDQIVVQGVQGRYFIPALTLLFLVIRNNTVELKADFDGKLIFALSSMNGCMFLYCLSRYI